jgi:hypothetical protein
MRLRLLAPALTVATLAAPAYAQDDFDPATAVEEFLTDAATLGATEATVGEITEDGDTIVATDVSMTWTMTLASEGENATITATATIPTIEVTGLEETDDGYAVTELAIPTIDFEMSADGPQEPFSFTVSVSDYVIVNGEWEPFPVIADNPAAPISRFAPLVHWSMVQSYEENSVENVTVTTVDAGEEQTFNYGPVAVGPVENGVLAEFTYPEITMAQPTEMPDGNGGTTTSEVTITYGPITGRDIDLRPLSAFLTGIDAGAESNVVMGESTVERILVEGDGFNVSTGNIVVQNFSIDPTRGPLMAQFDQFAIAAENNTEPDPVSMIDMVLDLYNAYGYDLYSVQDINVTAPDFNMTVGDVRTEGLSTDGLDRVAVLDVSVNGLNGSGALQTFEMGGFVWPEREAFMAAMMQGMAGAQPTPEAILAALPTMGNIAVRGFNFDAANVGNVQLGNFSLNLGGYIGAIPTSLAIALEGLVMPASLLPDPGMAMMAQAIGADPVEADAEISLRWDEDTQRFELSKDVTVGSVGRLEADATLSGIPRTIFEDPTQAQAALATAAVNGLTVRFEDAGLTPFVLGMIGQQAGVPPEEFAAGIASQVEAQLGAITGDPAFAGSVAEAVRTFLADPQSLTITSAPQNPVPVAQIMGAAMTAPAALPGILGFSIVANGQ